MKWPITLSDNACVELVNGWRLHFAEPDPVLRGIFTVNGHDYFSDGRPLAPQAPRILSVVP